MGNHLDFCKSKSKECKEEREKQEDHRVGGKHSNEILGLDSHVVCLCFLYFFGGLGRIIMIRYGEDIKEITY